MCRRITIREHCTWSAIHFVEQGCPGLNDCVVSAFAAAMKCLYKLLWSENPSVERYSVPSRRVRECKSVLAVGSHFEGLDGVALKPARERKQATSKHSASPGHQQIARKHLLGEV